MRAATPARRRRHDVGNRQLRLGEDGRDHAVEPGTQARRGHGRIAESLDQLIVAEQLVDVRPDITDRPDDAGAGLLGATREAQHPLHGVIAVVVDLLERFLGDRGEGLVAAAAQRRVELEHVGRHDELSGDRLGEVAVGLLHDPRATELGLVAEEGEVVFAAAVVRPRVVQERARVAEQVERDVAQGHVLLQLRGPRDPGAQLLGEDEGVISEAQCVLGDVGGRGHRAGAGELLREAEFVDRDVAVDVAVNVDVLGRGGRVRCAHRCGTPSEAV